MRIKEILVESLNETLTQPLPWNKYKEPYGYEYTFKTPSGQQGMASLLVKHGTAELMFDINGEMGVTGKGEAFPVFSTVMDIAKNAANDPIMDDVYKIQFSAKSDEPSRIKFYQRLAKMLDFPGYEYVGQKTGDMYAVFKYIDPQKKAEWDAHQEAKRQAAMVPPEEQIEEEVSQQELNQVETFADRLWNKFGIDVAFTRHFFDRVNDPRNGKPISAAELVRLFKKEYERHGKQIAGMDGEAVMKDTGTDVNMPFAKQGNKIAAKTIMRKKNFMTPDPEYVVSEDDPCWKGYHQIGTKEKSGRQVPNCVPLEETKR